MKRILDSVHGYILVDDSYFVHIIDKPYYQRLRRIEQTSTRSIFPSARHDRFIHSLGVFHIGKMIVEHLKDEAKTWDLTPSREETIYQSYLVACLLHDVGHAPFSHTFENYFGRNKQELAERLGRSLGKVFNSDLFPHIDDPAFHEYVSAILSVEQYAHSINILGGDVEMVARMIIGCFYSNQAPKEKQIENCFISLLHGDVIDADRLDYACRDVWASGYCTSTIDLKRLISALHIKKNKKKDYVVCFDSNAINEIESVINVKDFQVKYVINHHSVIYEQWLLVKAVEFTALKLFPQEDDDIEVRGTNALRALCSIDCMERSVSLNGKYQLQYPSDGDFIFLMKQDDDNRYFKEWYGRQYAIFSLWKSREEFYHDFNFIPRDFDLWHHDFIPTIKQTIIDSSDTKYTENDILVLLTKYKPRVKMSSLYIKVRDDVMRYTDLYPEEENKNENTFYYVYIKKKEGEAANDLKELRQKFTAALAPKLKSLYGDLKNA